MCSTGGGAEPWQALQSAAQVLAGEDVTSWSDEQVREGVLSLLTVANQLTAVLSHVSVSFDTRGLAEQDGFRTARSWLIAFGRMSQGAASGWLSRGRLLARLPALSAAAHSGAVSAEQIRIVGDLVGHVGIDAVQPLDEILAGVAAAAGPGEVAQACERIRAHVDPDGPDPDPHAGERRALSISRFGSLFYVSGRLDLEGGATLLTALDTLSRPTTPDDPRTGVQRRADALVELARQTLQAGTLPTVGGVRPQLGLLITPDTLLGLRNATATPGAGTVVHSDRGYQFTSAAWLNLVSGNGLEVSLGERKSCHDNAAMESWFASFKTEALYPIGTPATRDEARTLLFQYIWQYNNHRLHSTLGYVSPTYYAHHASICP